MQDLSVSALLACAAAGTPLKDVLHQEMGEYHQNYLALAPSLAATLESASIGALAGEDGGGTQDEAEGDSGSELYLGVSHAEAQRAVAWADAVVDRCGIPGPSGSDVALLPLLCAVPKV